MNLEEGALAFLMVFALAWYATLLRLPEWWRAVAYAVMICAFIGAVVTLILANRRKPGRPE